MFFSDNGDGGKFHNEEYRQMSEKSNVETCTVESSFSNGTVESSFCNGTMECYNLIIAEAMEKTLVNKKCEPEIDWFVLLELKVLFKIIWGKVHMS